MTADNFQHASSAEREQKLKAIDDFIRRDDDAVRWLRHFASGLMDQKGRSPKKASGALNMVLHTVDKAYQVSPATFQRFAKIDGGTRYPSSRLLALLVIFVLSVRDGALSESRDLVGNFMEQQTRPALVQDLENILGWKKPAHADDGQEDRIVRNNEPLPLPPRGDQVGAIRVNLFHAMTDFFKIDDSIQRVDRDAVLGTYKMWRYSTQYPGEYVLGKIEITDETPEQCPGAGGGLSPLRVKVRQVRKRRDGVRSDDEIVEGYFFRFPNIHMMLVRDTATSHPRCTILKFSRRGFVGYHADPDSIYPAETNHIVDFVGFAMGMDADLTFFSPVYLQLVDNRDELAELDDKLDIIPESEVPERILRSLKRHPLQIL
jgi:hypothetical protein